ncbi:MAG: hypothetical protein HOG33_00145 [Candidatus Marinimicrobia bacterium]|mgnify:FL=1|jgi:hypothetical protein|nr:hypothetical protein [Candidatus Neomarinimicrobiota bacterium]MBT4951717.1 hypothetical protein [Pelagibacteraceae bacterium]MBT3796552.1 hypothetical protein [Candidatus Neomarinimicrobiota bacterium]MBT4150164.1 hypothetical protein [Candidatus Neomarinimicrobiota bacterium]MBT5096694.1 hypothetical protein [Candidatus Neomarinimicrobiota bacterium]
MYSEISKKNHLTWRVFKALLYILGIGFLFLLINDSLRVFPTIPNTVGRDAFWNILIYTAPLLFTLAPGIWRNICPLATTSMFPRHIGISQKRKQNQDKQGWFYLISVLILYILLPLRHVETSGLSVVIALICIAILAIVVGFIYQGKSGWCSGLCPVFPVEKLYGTKPLITVDNVQCSTCINCVMPCADSVNNITPSSNKDSIASRFASFIFVGGFPGFVWGWFQVPDFSDRMEGWNNLGAVYGLPICGLVFSLGCFTLLKDIFSKKKYDKIELFYAATAISCYYWYRTPSILGLGDVKGVFGLDLSEIALLEIILRTITTLFFYWWFLLRDSIKSWEYRPKIDLSTYE